MTSVFDMSKEQLEQLLAGMGEKPYRAKQILGWVYQKFASSWDEMSDLPLALRQSLVETVKVSQLELLRKQEGDEEWAKRFVWGEEGKALCESVLLSYKYGLTGCISTQSGCPVGCAFCASSLIGFDRSLTKGEIVEEFVGMCRSQAERLGHLVFMGTGEPFMNYDNVMAAMDVLCDPTYYGLSRRKVTVSTVGIPSAMKKYAGDCRGARLALSLHAADDETRDQIIPINKRYPLAAVLEALREFSTLTGQRVTIEYMLLKGLNDSMGDAAKLARLIGGIDCLVNLIPWNEVPGSKWRSPEPARRRTSGLP
jgi:23S rRNA (adenine2503-C2)-methyltransferase